MSENYVEIHNYGGLNGWATISYADSMGGYEWDQIHVLRGPDGALYVGTGRGCSCNYFGDNGPGGFTRVTGWPEARKLIQEWISEGDEHTFDNSRRTPGLNLIERLNANPPRPRIEHDPSKGFSHQAVGA